MLKMIGLEGVSIRGKEHDGSQNFSVYDFMTKTCGYEKSGASARKEFQRQISEDGEYREELVASCHYLKFTGTGQRHTPCMTIRGLQRLLMILGGKVGAEYRAIAEGTLTRVMAGDTSLIEVINANAVSQAPIQQAFRAALAQEPVEPVLDEFCLVGQKREREMLDMAERRLRLEEGMYRLEESRRGKALEHTSTAIGLIKSFTVLDERTSLQFEDHIKNVILSSGRSFFDPSQQLALLANNNGNGHNQPVIINETESLSVSVLVGEMGHQCTDKDIQSIGRVMACKYREKYGKEPTKHKQFVKGNYVPVNSYMVRDRAMMEQAVREVVGGTK